MIEYDYFAEVMELLEDMKKYEKTHGTVLPLSAIAGYYAGRRFIDEKDIQTILKIESKILDCYDLEIKEKNKVSK